MNKDIAKVVCCTCNQTMQIINFRKWRCESCGFEQIFDNGIWQKAKQLFNSNKTLLSFLVRSNVNLESKK